MQFATALPAARRRLHAPHDALVMVKQESPSDCHILIVLDDQRVHPGSPLFSKRGLTLFLLLYYPNYYTYYVKFFCRALPVL
jgi:hypothetical protein